MIRRFFTVLLAATLLMGGARAATLPNMVRLQVVAASDSAEDQTLKLELRDACLRAAEVCLAGAADADDAYAHLCAHLDDFQRAVEARARALGYAGTLRCEAGAFAFPDRVYGKLRVPAGTYRALRVTIGAGAGHNWWCVLYPSLCLLDESALGGDPRDILDWLRARLFGGDAA